jgi:DNA repair exonuclease SbcCD nuclease subunit
MKQISFIHAADLHLDSPMVGLKSLPGHIFNRVRESTFLALKKLTETAIKRQVDFVVIAGDLFDGEDRSLRAQSRFRTEMLKLAEKEIPVYVVHGNHDHLSGSWTQLDMPANVHIFGREVETKVVQTKRGEIIHLYGFSYPQRHIFERKIDEYQKVNGADFHIGILHGNEGGAHEHDNYAPFSFKDLQDKDFDYWALGHIHKRMILAETPPIIYPGNIQGRNKKETGPKGFYHVTLTDIDNKLEFIEASDIVWEEAMIDASSARSFDEVFRLCQSAINHFRKEKMGTFITLELQNVQIDDYQEKRNIGDELTDLLQEDESDEEAFVWLVDLNIFENLNIDREKLATEANFFAEFFKTVDDYDHLDTALAPLYQHHIGRKYLSNISTSEQQELINNAEQLLLKLLYK